MVKDTNSADGNYALQVQMELLQLLVESEGTTYPWNTGDPESEIYFADQEQDFTLEDWSEEEIVTRSQSFFTRLEETWAATTVKDVPENE